MSATTVVGRVSSDPSWTHAKRTALIGLTVVALVAMSFFVGRATAHLGSTSFSAQVVGTRTQLSAANRALIAGEVAPAGVARTTSALSPANRALIAAEVAPVTEQLGHANVASCRVGQPC